MLLSSHVKLIGLLGTVTGVHANTSRQTSQSACADPSTFGTNSFYGQVVNNYLDLWSGNLSLLNEIISPGFHFYQDRVPFGQVDINNSSGLLAWIDHSRNSWTQFNLKARYYIAQGNYIALRWYLDGIIGNVSDHAPGSKLPPNSPITYNGTDFIILDPCTGLIDEVDSAQDFLRYFYNLEFYNITLMPGQIAF